MRSVLLTCLLALPALAAPPASRLDQKMDGHVNYNSGEVADLPDGPSKLYMTLVTSDDWQSDPGPRGQAQRKLRAWLENDVRLIQYRKGSNFNWFTQSDPAFTGARTLANGQASSLKFRLGEAYPILAVENPNGEALFKMSALSLPGSGGELADWMTTSIKRQATAMPAFTGQTEATPIVTEGQPIEQCGPDGCPFVPAPPNDSSDVIPDSAKPLLGGNYQGEATLAALLLLAGGGAAAGHYATRKRN